MMVCVHVCRDNQPEVEGQPQGEGEGPREGGLAQPRRELAGYW